MKYVYGVFYNGIDSDGYARESLEEEYGLFKSKEEAIQAIRDEDVFEPGDVEFIDTKIYLEEDYSSKDGSDMTFCEYAIAPQHVAIAGEDRRQASILYIKKIPLK